MKKVICPGEALIDFVSIDLGKSLKETSGFLKKAGGAPANVAAAISKLGADAYFCGTVGNDFFGEFADGNIDLSKEIKKIFYYDNSFIRKREMPIYE